MSEEYSDEAETISQLFEQLLTYVEKIESMTHTEDITSCYTEVQVSHEESGLVGRCVVDIVAAGRVQLHKSLLSTFLKSNSTWPSMRIEKKGVYSALSGAPAACRKRQVSPD